LEEIKTWLNSEHSEVRSEVLV